MAQEAKSSMNADRVRRMPFSDVYPLYIRKVERKGRAAEEVDAVIRWLTGYDKAEVLAQVRKGVDFETFFAEAPRMNPNASKITGMICGYRIEDIEDEVIRKVRYLDKLVDELAKGKSMEKILRS